METLANLQTYWWLIISVLGSALVFLLFVQGGQTMLYGRNSESTRQLMVNSLGMKWELTYTTLVVFGGAFFASFPLFYSTSFGGAYWLWMLILLSFVVQAFSYEFRRRRGNIYGTHFYDSLLFFNGLFGCVLLGVAVGTMFFGGDFTITRTNLLDTGSGNPVISCWGPMHGMEAIACWKNLLLGFAVFFLARTMAALYFVNNIRADRPTIDRFRKTAGGNGIVFAILFVAFLVVLMLQSGYREEAGKLVEENNIYLHNYLTMWYWGVLLLAGVAAALYGIFRTAFSRTWRSGIWAAGVGAFVVVLSLFAVAGFGGTAYLPSLTDPASSLTLQNSSSSIFTLKVMSCVSVLIPFVLAYIWYVWAKMNSKPMSESNLKAQGHQY